VSLVSVARLGCGRVSDRIRTRPAAVCEPCRQTSFIGPAILRGMRSATRANAARHWKPDEPARRRSAPSSSSPLRSCIGHRCSIGCASPGRDCGQWTVLLLSCALRRLVTNRNRLTLRFTVCAEPLQCYDLGHPRRAPILTQYNIGESYISENFDRCTVYVMGEDTTRNKIASRKGRSIEQPKTHVIV
jgi:hypothetical protein